MFTEKEANAESRHQTLEVDAHDSVHEKEAEAISMKVIHGDQLTGGGDNSIGQVRGGGNKNDGLISRKGAGDGEQGMIAPAVVGEKINSAKGGGDVLPDEMKHQMKSTVGGELDDVRIHTDSNAAEMSKAVNANAFTVGKDIYFGQGQFDTYTSKGKELLVHELAHTQQNVNRVQRKIYETDEFIAEKKLNDVYKTTIQTDTFKKLSNGYAGEHSIKNLRFNILPDIPRANAHTKAFDDNTTTIEFNKKYVDAASDISISRTLLHEMQHAEVSMNWTKAGGDDGKLGKDEYPGIYDYYTRYNNKPGYDTYQHQMMAQHKRGETISGMKDVDNLMGIKDRKGAIEVTYEDGSRKMVDYTSDDFYEAMSWGGLMGATEEVGGQKVFKKNAVWEKFKKENPDTAALYKAIILSESKFDEAIEGGVLDEIIIRPKDD